jgi:hypothetical protein
MLTEYEKTGALPAHNLEEYETLAQALVEAYGSGDDVAMQRVMDHFQIRRPLTWDQPSHDVRRARLRRGVRDRLGSQPGAVNESDTLALADAQLLVARSLGFENWELLAKHTEE